MLWETVRNGLRHQRKAPAIKSADRGGPLPASHAQQRLWFVEQLSGPSAQHNLCVAFRLVGQLDVTALSRSLDTLVERHEVLRTTLHWQDDQLRQRIAVPGERFTLQVETLPAQDTLQEWAEQEAGRPFDLAHPPGLRARLLGLGQQDHCLLLTLHHLVFDGWSFEIFMNELGLLYGAYRLQAPNPLPAIRLHYADYAVWQHQWLQDEVLQPLYTYWKAQLAAPPAPLALAACPVHQGRQPQEGGCFEFQLSTQLSHTCLAFAKDEGVTPFMLLFTAYQILLHRRSGETDIVIGTPVANRNRADLTGLIGMLVNMLALRNQLDGTVSTRQLLAQNRQVVLDAHAHQDLPFELLIGALDLPRQLHAPPLLQSTFSYLNLPSSGWNLPGLSVQSWNVPNGTSRFGLSLSMWEKQEQLAGGFEYDKSLFSVRDMQALARQWEALLDGMVTMPDRSIATLPLLPAADYTLWIKQAQGALPDYPREQSVHRVFESVVTTHGDKVALIHGIEHLSYTVLNEKANQLAHQLRNRGLAPGQLVGISLSPGIPYVITILAVLKAGAAYLPVMPGEPWSRLEAGLKGQEPDLLIQATGDETNLAPRSPRLALDSLTAETGQSTNLPGPTQANGLAYVMFTSGSSGVPKGVKIPHRGIVRLACGADYARLGPTERMLQLAPIGFDASTFEIWACLLNGASLVIPTRQRPSLSEIASLLKRHEISTLWLTSGLFELLLDTEPSALAALRQLLVGGDVVSPTHARRYLQLSGTGSLINCYGPTENTTFSTFHPVTLQDVGAALPIGRPISQSAVYVLDADRQPVPPGVVGEAWLAGDGLMLGYLSDTASGAVGLEPNPYSGEVDALMYRTGDWVRQRSDGSLLFLGRRDEQLKLRGYRIEPGEVEAALLRHPAVQQAMVTVAATQAGKQLLAYVVSHEKPEYSVELEGGLRDYLQSQLPEPMRPSWIVHLPALPLTRNGKLDRGILPTDYCSAPEDYPADTLEQQIEQAFGQILGRERIGRHAAFFEIGGHSLLALRLLAWFESNLSLRLPLVSLFEHSTPARLAGYIRLRQPELTLNLPGLVEIRRGQQDALLFMVPGGRGGMAEMALYARLMQYLARDLTVLGLLATGLEEPSTLPGSVAEMAGDYIARLKRRQPTGPYALAGECVGGVIAYEMARQLQAGGDKVSVLLLLDTWRPTRYSAWHYRCVQAPRLRWHSRWTKLQLAWNELAAKWDEQLASRPPFQPMRSTRFFLGTVLAQARQLASWRQQLAPQRTRADWDATAHHVGQNYMRRTMDYRPGSSTIPLYLLVSDTNHRLGLPRAWQRLATGGLELRIVPGDHESYLRVTPEAAAKALNDCLDIAFGKKD